MKAGGSTRPHAIYNIGNSRSEDLMQVVELLEQETGRKALLDPKPMQVGDVQETFADISAIERDHGFAPATSIDEGIPRFVAWYRDYHGLHEPSSDPAGAEDPGDRRAACSSFPIRSWSSPNAPAGSSAASRR